MSVSVLMRFCLTHASRNGDTKRVLQKKVYDEVFVQVNIHIPSDNDKKSSLIRIEGPPDGVREARKQLEEMGARMVN